MKLFDERTCALALQNAFVTGAEWRESQPVRMSVDDAYRLVYAEARRQYPAPQTARETLSGDPQ